MEVRQTKQPKRVTTKRREGRMANTLLRWNLQQISREFGTHREQLERRRRALGMEPGEDGNFSSQDVARLLFGDKEAETIGKISAERRKTECEVETMRRERIPIEVMSSVNAEAFGAMAAIIKAHKGKVLTDDVISDLQSALRDVPKKLKWTK